MMAIRVWDYFLSLHQLQSLKECFAVKEMTMSSKEVLEVRERERVAHSSISAVVVVVVVVGPGPVAEKKIYKFGSPKRI